MSFHRIAIFLWAASVWALPAAALAQKPPAEKPPAEEAGDQPGQSPQEQPKILTAERRVVIFRLQYALASELAAKIQELTQSEESENTIVAPEAATNSLIVSAGAEPLKQIEGLIKALDVEEAAKEQPVLEIISLKTADARESAKVIENLYGSAREIRLGIDERSNSIIVSALPRQLEEIKSVIAKLGDAAGRTDHQVRVFQLENIEPDENLQSILLTICQSPDARFAIDTRSNSVVVTGPENTMQLVEMLLVRLDQSSAAAAKPAAESRSPLQVRVVWLVSGLARDDATKPGADLDDVVAELAKIGFVDPIVASNVVVNTSNGNEFRVSGAAQLDKPCDLDIVGRVVSDSGEDGPSLNIQIHANDDSPAESGRGFGGPPRRAALCMLDTTISAPLGHSIVLGVSPLKTMTSAFVVQVTSPPRPGAKPSGGDPSPPRRR